MIDRLNPEIELLRERFDDAEIRTPIPAGFGRARWLARITGALGTALTLLDTRAGAGSPPSEFAFVLRDQFLWHGVEAIRALVDDLATCEGVLRVDALDAALDDVGREMQGQGLALIDGEPAHPHEEIGACIGTAVSLVGQAAVFSGAVRADGRPDDASYRRRLVQIAAFTARLAARQREWAGAQLGDRASADRGATSLS